MTTVERAQFYFKRDSYSLLRINFKTMFLKGSNHTDAIHLIDLPEKNIQYLSSFSAPE